jgi:hypothetical protein
MSLERKAIRCGLDRSMLVATCWSSVTYAHDGRTWDLREHADLIQLDCVYPEPSEEMKTRRTQRLGRTSDQSSCCERAKNAKPGPTTMILMAGITTHPYGRTRGSSWRGSDGSHVNVLGLRKFRCSKHPRAELPPQRGRHRLSQSRTWHTVPAGPLGGSERW